MTICNPETCIDIHVPIDNGFLRVGTLRELVDALDGLPDNVLVEVRPDELRYIESDEP